MSELIGGSPLALPPVTLGLGTRHKVTHIDVTLDDWSVDEYADGNIILNLSLGLVIYATHGGPYRFSIKRKYQASIPLDFSSMVLTRAPWRLHGKTLNIKPEVEFYKVAKKGPAPQPSKPMKSLPEERYTFYGKNTLFTV